MPEKANSVLGSCIRVLFAVFLASLIHAESWAGGCDFFERPPSFSDPDVKTLLQSRFSSIDMDAVEERARQRPRETLIAPASFLRRFRGEESSPEFVQILLADSSVFRDSEGTFQSEAIPSGFDAQVVMRGTPSQTVAPETRIGWRLGPKGTERWAKAKSWVSRKSMLVGTIALVAYLMIPPAGLTAEAIDPAVVRMDRSLYILVDQTLEWLSPVAKYTTSWSVLTLIASRLLPGGPARMSMVFRLPLLRRLRWLVSDNAWSHKARVEMVAKEIHETIFPKKRSKLKKLLDRLSFRSRGRTINRLLAVIDFEELGMTHEEVLRAILTIDPSLELDRSTGTIFLDEVLQRRRQEREIIETERIRSPEAPIYQGDFSEPATQSGSGF